MQGTMVFLVLRVRSPVSNEIRRYTVRQYLIAPSGGITCRLDNNAGRHGEPIVEERKLHREGNCSASLRRFGQNFQGTSRNTSARSSLPRKERSVKFWISFWKISRRDANRCKFVSIHVDVSRVSARIDTLRTIAS